MKTTITRSRLEVVFVQNVRLYLSIRHMNQNDIADALDIKHPSVSAKMNGKAAWSISDIEKVATLLQVKPEILLSDEVLEKMGLVGGRNPQPTT